MSSQALQEAEAEWEWFFPPEDPNDVSAWDRYWADQVEHDLGPPLFDLFLTGRGYRLVETARQRGLKTVLCAGTGISLEPRALAHAGLDVTALDVSAVALDIAERYPANDDVLSAWLGRPIAAPGGNVAFVVGDLFDAGVCPGPFDVIIERRCIQAFSPPARDEALAALAARLAPNGLCVSHFHVGCWRPGQPLTHAAEAWFEEHGFAVWSESPDGAATTPGGSGGPTVWLSMSTG
jgi:SAM-dependent methyltransferase